MNIVINKKIVLLLFYKTANLLDLDHF